MDLGDEKINFLKQLISDNNWETVLNSNGITTEKRMLPQSDIACFRSYGLINADRDDLVEFVWNTYNTKESVCYFDPDVTDYRIIKDMDDRTRLCCQINTLPWPLWQRESVYLQRLDHEQTTSYIIMYSVESNAAPIQEDKYVRTNINISAYAFESQGLSTMVYRIAHIDPSGKIPVSLVNSYANKSTTMIKHLMSVYNQ